MPTMKSLTFSFPLLLLAGLASLPSLACGSSSSDPAKVYVTSTLGLNTMPGATGTCNIMTPEASFFTIGTPGAPAPTGTSENGETVNVTCAVDQVSGGDYEVNIQVSDGELYGLTISGTINSTPGAVQSNITAGFNKLNSSNYTESDCTLTLSTDQNFQPPILGGRIAASIICPTITDDGANPVEVCYATATFFLENCN